MPRLEFPAGFLWGTSTAAHQIEGNNTNSDWWRWEHSEQRARELRNQNKNPEDYYSGVACDSYNRFEQDFDLAKSLNHNAFRLSIEWARIEPNEGQFDQREIEHYRKVLQSLCDHGMKSVVTFHHFTSPVWFMDKGGWEKSSNAKYFVRYVEKVVDVLGDLIDFTTIINEINMYAGQSYVRGAFPPQKHSPWTAFKVTRTMIKAHNQAARLIKVKAPHIQRGTAINVIYEELVGPLRPFLILGKWIYHTRIINGIISDLDFLGFNYYTRYRVGLSFRPPFVHVLPGKNKVSDFGWEIYPQGLLEVLYDLKKYGKPIYITENGIADAEDKNRKDYIRGHLAAIHKAITEGVPVKGYLHWSLLDNFEWADAYDMKFGLADRNRVSRESAKYYAEICKNNYLDI